MGFVQNADFAENEGTLKNLAVAGGDSNDTNNLLTITGEDGLVYQVHISVKV